MLASHDTLSTGEHDMAEYQSASQVATRLGVSVETVNRWCRSRQLRAVKAGRAWRIREEDLNVFLRRGGEHEEKHDNGLARWR